MQITIPDDLYARYAEAATRAHLQPARLIERQLARFAETPITQQVLALTGDTLQEVDQLLGIGSTRDASSFLAAVRAWAGITIGDIRLQFSPAQLEEIAYRAAKQGKSPEAVVRDIVAQMEHAFFNDTVPMR